MHREGEGTCAVVCCDVLRCAALQCSCCRPHTLFFSMYARAHTRTPQPHAHTHAHTMIHTYTMIHTHQDTYAYTHSPYTHKDTRTHHDTYTHTTSTHTTIHTTTHLALQQGCHTSHSKMCDPCAPAATHLMGAVNTPHGHMAPKHGEWAPD